MKTLLICQGIYYLLTALWPLVHMRSFEAVAGPKKEKWLVYTVSSLLVGPSLVFLKTGLGPGEVSQEILLLSICGCLGLALIDFIFVLKGVIWKTYLIDGVAELFILLLMVFLRFR